MAEDDYVFDHVGITTTECSRRGWVEPRASVTNPRNHPEHIEFLRYRADSTVPDAVRYNPHVAYRVKDLKPHIEAEEILIPPFVSISSKSFGKYGMVFEYMRYLKDGWFN